MNRKRTLPIENLFFSFCFVIILGYITANFLSSFAGYQEMNPARIHPSGALFSREEISFPNGGTDQTGPSDAIIAETKTVSLTAFLAGADY